MISDWAITCPVLTSWQLTPHGGFCSAEAATTHFSTILVPCEGLEALLSNAILMPALRNGGPSKSNSRPYPNPSSSTKPTATSTRNATILVEHSRNTKNTGFRAADHGQRSFSDCQTCVTKWRPFWDTRVKVTDQSSILVYCHAFA